MKRYEIIAMITAMLIAMGLLASSFTIIQRDIDPSIIKALSKYGSITVYVSKISTSSNSCYISIDNICIEKHEVSSIEEVERLRSQPNTISVWGYYVETGEAVYPKLSVQSLNQVSISSIASTQDGKFSTGIRPYPPPRNITIAIIDTGIDYDHPDIEKNIVGLVSSIITHENNTLIEQIPFNKTIAHQLDEYCISKTGYSCFKDSIGHGTFVAGIITADGLVKGITPGVKIIMIKAFIGASTTVEAILRALKWVYDNAEKYNITVVNGSWGINGATTGKDPISIFIDKLYKDKKVITVIASGNTGLRPGSINIPCGSQYVICVGAFDPSKWSIADFSGAGATTNNLIRPDFIMPGVGILSTLPGGYGIGSGTSFSTPQLTSIIALLQSQGIRDRYVIEKLLSQRTIYKVMKTKDPVGGHGLVVW